MNKEIFIKIDKFLESKGFNLLLLALLLVLLPIVLSLGLTNEKLEEQIIEHFKEDVNLALTDVI